MNLTDASCSTCGEPTRYDGRLPILCGCCRNSQISIGFIIPAKLQSAVCAQSTCDDCEHATVVNDRIACSKR